MCQRELKSIRYSLHFPLLIVALLVFWLAKDIFLPYWIANFDFFITDCWAFFMQLASLFRCETAEQIIRSRHYVSSRLRLSGAQ